MRPYSQGDESPLPELPVQYGDFAVWQRGWLQGEELERQLGYWRKQLGGDVAGAGVAHGSGATGSAKLPRRTT